ncbi:hypothetical protein ES703_105351 [subsurface metagenome]
MTISGFKMLTILAIPIARNFTAESMTFLAKESFFWAALTTISAVIFSMFPLTISSMIDDSPALMN